MKDDVNCVRVVLLEPVVTGDGDNLAAVGEEFTYTTLRRSGGYLDDDSAFNNLADPLAGLDDRVDDIIVLAVYRNLSDGSTQEFAVQARVVSVEPMID